MARRMGRLMLDVRNRASYVNIDCEDAFLPPLSGSDVCED